MAWDLRCGAPEMKGLSRFLRALPLLAVSPALLLIVAVVLAIADLMWFLRPRIHLAADTAPNTGAATIVIPTWNGRDLLEKHLASVVAAVSGSPDNEILVIDNGSDDGTADFVRRRFPAVKVIALERNLGFGGGSNAGFRAAANDIVVLLNNDMRVAPDFLQPLLDGFTDEKVFSVSCQIFFSDEQKVREETGLTQGWWENGSLRVRHRIDAAIQTLYPCFYGGGGSSAFDRRKFLELGGFDPLLAPFYLEDADLGYMAWKRGWKVLYQPRSVVYHEHRGTIGRRFSPGQIRSILAKNFVLWSWKNVHQWSRLGSHFFFLFSGALLSTAAGESPERATLDGLWRAFRQLPGAARSRWEARSLAAVDDTEAFLRPMGGYFRDRFSEMPSEAGRLRVLFVSPYPVFPPTHGGAVLMYQTLRELTKYCEVHLIALLDYPYELPAHEEQKQAFDSAEFLVRMNGKPASAGSILPHAVREFASEELAWLIHRQICTQEIDLVQLEYTPMAQYAGRYRRIGCVLFEHDIYFQSIARGWSGRNGLPTRLKAAFEYLRALHYETRVLPRLDGVQACTRENARYLLSFVPGLAGRIRDDVRAGIDASRYCFRPSGRESGTMLFIGAFRHPPNQAALDWFTRGVLPLVAERYPSCRFVVVGSDPPPAHAFSKLKNVELRGFVEDIREPLSRYAAFVCPILSGSGVRVKLLEAFASGIPVVSTRLGAEGLTDKDGELCSLADDPRTFAGRILALFDEPERAAEMAARARSEVLARWDMAAITTRLVDSYRQILREKRARAVG